MEIILYNVQLKDQRSAVVVIVWSLDLQLHCTYAIMPITNNVVNSNPAQAWFN